MVKLDIFSDPICPWCYIGTKNLFNVLKSESAFVFEIEWHPFLLNPEMPDQGMDRCEYLEEKFGGKEAAIKAYLPVVEHANAADLSFDFAAIQKTPNTLKAHCLIRWAHIEGCQNEMAEALFSAYFCKGLDIGDVAVLSEVAEAVGFNPILIKRLFSSSDERLEIQNKDKSAKEMGIQAVPAFIIAGQYVVNGAQSPDLWRSVMRDIKNKYEH